MNDLRPPAPAVDYGPQGEHLAALIERLRALTEEDVQRIDTSFWDAARAAARASAMAAARAAWATRDVSGDAWATWYAVRNAAGYAIWGVVCGTSVEPAARVAAMDVAENAARALLVRDLISQDHYDTLTYLLRRAGITVHPDDAPIDA